MFYRKATSYFSVAIIIFSLFCLPISAQAIPQFSDSEFHYPYGSATQVSCADINGDGIIDVVSANRYGGTDNLGSVSIFLGDESGIIGDAQHFSVPLIDEMPRSLVVVDVDNDLDLDLVTANWLSDSLTIFRNDGTGYFTAESMGTTELPTAVNAADIDQDGDQDLLVTNSYYGSGGWQASLQVHLNDENNNFVMGELYQLPAEPRAIKVGDLDLDGDLDLGIACRGGGKIALLFNDSLGGFSEMSTIDVGVKPRELVFSDLDDDNDLDIGVAMFMDPTEIGEAWIIENLGDRQFQVAKIFTAGVAPHGIAVADLDNDCDQDLVIANVGSSHATILINEGSDLNFSLAQVSMAAQAVITIADLDKDDRPDLLAGHPSTYTNGFGKITIRRNMTPPCQACSIPLDTIVDCNNNGVHDICDVINGTSEDCNNNDVPDSCDLASGENDDNGDGVLNGCVTACIADINNSGSVDLGDFSIMLIEWGCTADCSADINTDGVVDLEDFSSFLILFGETCEQEPFRVAPVDPTRNSRSRANRVPR